MTGSPFGDALSALRLKQLSKTPRYVGDILQGLRPGFQDGYDYYNALKYGVSRIPTSDGHMGSRVPQTGLILKSPQHPTFPLTVRGEEEAGYELYVGPGGRIYSRPKKTKKGKK